MKTPSISQFQNSVNNGQLTIDDELVAHPAFSALLKALQQKQLSFSSPRIELSEESNILIQGNCSFLSIPLEKAHFYLYQEQENDSPYEFEWHGTLAVVTLKDLYDADIMSPLPMELMDGLLQSEFVKADFLYTSFDQAFAIEALSSDIKLALPGLGFSLEKLGFHYERSLNHSVNTSCRLYSTIKLGSTAISTSLEIPAGNAFDLACWTLETTDVVFLNNGINDALAFLSGQQALNEVLANNLLTTLLPETIQQIPLFCLTDLKILFTPDSLRLLEFSIQSQQKFEIVKDFAIDCIGIGVFATFSQNTPSFRLSLFGVFSFVETIEVGITIQVPLDLDGDWVIDLESETDLKRLQDLEKLPFLKLEDLSLPAEWLSVDNIRLERLKIVFNPGAAKIKTVNFSLALIAQSSLIPGITVKNPHLEFNLTMS